MPTLSRFLESKFYLQARTATLGLQTSLAYNLVLFLPITPTNCTGSIVLERITEPEFYTLPTHTSNLSPWNEDASTAASPTTKVGTMVATSTFTSDKNDSKGLP